MENPAGKSADGVLRLEFDRRDPAADRRTAAAARSSAGMNGSSIHALERKPGERCVRMKARPTLLAWNALPLPTWAPGSPRDDGSGLPIPALWPQNRPTEAGHPVDVG